MNGGMDTWMHGKWQKGHLEKIIGCSKDPSACRIITGVPSIASRRSELQLGLYQKLNNKKTSLSGKVWEYRRRKYLRYLKVVSPTHNCQTVPKGVNSTHNRATRNQAPTGSALFFVIPNVDRRNQAGENIKNKKKLFLKKVFPACIVSFFPGGLYGCL